MKENTRLVELTRAMRYLISVAILTAAVQCTVQIMKPQELKWINSEWENVVFQVKEDIRPEFSTGEKREEDIIFRKNAKVRIWVEASSEWIKVKAYPNEDKREQARGRIIVFVFKDDLGDRKPLEFIKEKILALLVPAKP